MVRLRTACSYYYYTVPPDPVTSLTAGTITNSSVFIAWENGFDGRAPIVATRIEYFIEGETESMTIEIEPYPTNFTLTELRPNSPYNILVSVVNALSLASDPTSILVTTLSLCKCLIII